MASSARNQVGLPRSSLGCRGGGADRGRGTARCWEWCSGCWGSSGGGVRIAAAPVRLINVCVPRRARASVARCPSMLFSFFFHFALSGGRAPFCCGEACEPYLHWWWKLVVC